MGHSWKSAGAPVLRRSVWRWLSFSCGVAAMSGASQASALDMPPYPAPGLQVVFDVTLRTSPAQAVRRGKGIYTVTVTCRKGAFVRLAAALNDGQRKIETESTLYRMIAPVRIRTRVSPGNTNHDRAYHFHRKLLDDYLAAGGAHPMHLVALMNKAGQPLNHAAAFRTAASVTLAPAKAETIQVPAGRFETVRVSVVWRMALPTRAGQTLTIRTRAWIAKKLGYAVRIENRQIFRGPLTRSISHTYVAAKVARVTPPSDGCAGMPSR